jgi:hypothetical protein
VNNQQQIARPFISAPVAIVICVPLVIAAWWGGFLAYSYYIVNGHALSDVSIKLSPLEGFEWKMKTEPK